MKNKNSEETIFWNDLTKWAGESKTKGTLSSYKTYSKNETNDDIPRLYSKKDFLYALTLVETKIKEIETAPVKTPNASNTRSALKYIKEFLRTHRIQCNAGSDNLDNIREKISKPDIHKIDGIDPIVTLLNGDEAFVKLAIESSYFFSIEIVKERHSELCKLFKGSSPIPARKSNKKDNHKNDEKHSQENGHWYYEDNDLKKTPIDIDGDGNKSVREIIRDKTGYTIAEGKKCIFQNYNISHIWGRAYDPRYFTSLWNIVFIPSWANSLMDKDAISESIASKLKNTYMSICENLYFKNIGNNWWKNMQLTEAPTTIYLQDKVKAEYNISIINKVCSNNKISAIHTKKITIK